jgi:hypothetical protein
MITVIVHDPVPHEISPITADEMKDALEALGYHVQSVLVRNDYAPPHWLVRRDIDKHLGPFSTRLDACTALDLVPADDSAWEVLGDDEFKTYLDVRYERFLRQKIHAATPTSSTTTTGN